MKRIPVILLAFLLSISIAHAGYKPKARWIATDDSLWGVNISTSADTVQKALDELNTVVVSSATYSETSSTATFAESVNYNVLVASASYAPGASTFLDLTDTPADWETGKYFKSWTSSGTWETPAGGGDMLKVTYDTDSSDVVDNSEALSGYAYTHFLDTATADSTYLKKSEDDSSNYKLTLSSLAVTNTATVGSLSSSGQVTSNGNKLIDIYDWAVVITTPTWLGTDAVLISPIRSFAITITTITMITTGGTNFVGMIEQRAYASPHSAGTDIWSGDVTVSSTTWTTGTVSDYTVPANYGLYLKPTSVSGPVKILTLRGIVSKD